jgi:general secretion pathway protein N
MPTRRRLIIAGLITLIAGLIIMFPARVAYNWFAPAGVAINGIRGTIWSGAAGHVSANGVYVGNLRWRIKPLRLFTGKLAYKIEGRPASGFLEGNAAVGFGGRIYLEDLTGSLPVQGFERSTGMRGLAGTANIHFERLVIDAGLPIAAIGTVDVVGLLLPLVDQSPLGGFHAEFFTQEDGIVASIEDVESVIELAGSLTLTNDRKYQFLGQVAAKADTPPQLRQQLRFLGSANDRGQYELRLEGQL